MFVKHGKKQWEELRHSLTKNQKSILCKHQLLWNPETAPPPPSIWNEQSRDYYLSLERYPTNTSIAQPNEKSPPIVFLNNFARYFHFECPHKTYFLHIGCFPLLCSLSHGDHRPKTNCSLFLSSCCVFLSHGCYSPFIRLSAMSFFNHLILSFHLPTQTNNSLSQHNPLSFNFLSFLSCKIIQ